MLSILRKIAIFLLACLLAAGPAHAQGRGPLVLAAASLQEAMNQAADAWAARKHPRPVISFASSAALARQIEAGAPADLFVSADEDWMNHVAGKGLIRPSTRTAFLSNRLVLIAPAASTARLTIARGFPLARALGNGRLAMADPDAVPAGKYGKAALTRLGVWTAVAPKVARAENVRAALALVERGAAPFGIVYATDARASTQVKVIGVFPPATHPPITYPIALLKTSTDPQAEAFRRFLISREGKAIFVRHGFTAR
ncbi:molybdate ABC transporter substrate-binding protein [Novosphingobium album (ex Liu et al. 2023)]|uniref:Molybdate ABC transporter substrate-binding protein n=1 Tax=Novosphingobium album (ex Liu et al. 2023) TaxID=3031130 RepID=A0ABT5WTE2_9SPHN|nr:molybdate ABC transporter substrate-binding protein [Novosphingobium album (ex Liu et al. 2023)]MDE8652903.1 molybdate ABC transporter substrate-binding protein [Novosphingobium album (ex Liu et al. 2023)]